ncbi:MAG TPA: M56 family metallopeptidase [Steroidobacteraceae bacterium]|nr:M56 family metallopeptidase [Steroidobacteraceae bacterium]
MLAWMLYVMAVTLLLAAAAWVAEYAQRLRHSSTRWIWVLAIVLSLLIPTVIASVSIQIPNILSPAVSQKVIALRTATSAHLSPTLLISGSPRTVAEWRKLDPFLERAWPAVSIAMWVGLMASGAHLYWRKRNWSTGMLGGARVYIAPEVGPAVVGLLRPSIVVPTWLISSSPSHQDAVIAHESSHLDAGDTRLFTAALFLLVFMPWNLPLWWQLRRLRYAIEVDCDRRVLKSGQDAVGYGETLIAVGERKSTYIGAVAAMSESKSFLERRIMIMMSKPAKWWRASAMALLAFSVALVAVAAQVSPPNAAGGVSSTHVEVQVDASVLDGYVGSYKAGERAVVTVTRNGQQLMAQLTGQPSAPIYPESATEFFYKIVDAQISFVQDTQGQATSLVLHQNGHNIAMPRVDAAAAQQIADSVATKIQGQTATPGSEAALKRLIAAIGAGKPNYDEMTPELAEATRQQLPNLRMAVSGFGAVQSVEFRGVGNQGWDLYDVKQEHGSMQWRIALDSNGKIAGALVTAGP